MALIATLAKVAIGYARSRGGPKGNDVAGVDPQKAREILDKAKAGREQAERLAADLKNGKARERLRGLTRRAVEQRLATGSPGETTDPEQDGVTPATVSEPEAELGETAMITAMSGAATGSGQSVDDLLEAYNSGGEVEAVEQSAALLLRAILMAAKADGEIDADERAVILDSLGASPDPDDLALVEELLAAPVDVAALAQATPPGQIVQVYSAALAAIRLDTPPEAVFLHRLAETLRLDEHVVNALHAQMGRPLLYRQD